jgi:hypothetical protein
MAEQKEISIFDYLPRVLPILDVIFIAWIALNSPKPWITTPIHIAMPVLGFSGLLLFRKKGKIGFYMIGFMTSLPVFFLNCWGDSSCPTWLTEFSLIAGGLLLTKDIWDRFAILGFSLVTTVPPLMFNQVPLRFIITIVIADLALWFLMERSVKFMEIQKALIREQKEEVEHKQKEILDSIHYAKRIQQSLLPPEKYIDRKLEELKSK